MLQAPPSRAQDDPGVAQPSGTPIAETSDLGSIVGLLEESDPALLQALTGAGPPPSFLGVALESLFGDAYSEASRADWRPLSLRTFFTDGWRDVYVEPPLPTGRAPRSGWVNSFDGALFRAWFLSFAFANDVNHDGNQYLGGYTLYAPLNRRFELRIDVPFIVSDKGGPGNSYHDRFGDLVISPRFLLSATPDFSQLFAINIRTPTGSILNGNGVDSLSPHYQFWSNPFGRWAVRGGTGVTVPTNAAGGPTSYFANLGVGRFWEGAEDAPLRHQWLTLVANLSAPLAGSAPGPTYLSLTPGYRVEFADRWFLLAGLQVSLTARSPFSTQPIFLLVKDY